MNIITKRIIIYSILISFSFIYIRVNADTIKSEDDFIDLIEKNKQSELEINISSIINIQNSFNITKSLKKLSIIGKSKETSAINFLDLTNRLYFGKNVNEIELTNISFNGNIYFDNNNKVTMNFVYIYGSINSNYDINNGYINIYNSTYDSSPIPDNECITLSGNIDIDNSKFFGSKCNLYTINFNGLDKYSFSLKNSYISGEYRSSCLIINQGLSVNIDASTFDKGYSSLDKEGGYIYLEYILLYCF